MNGVFGTNLRRLAGMHLITQAQLAQAVGMSEQGISNLMRGESKPSFETAQKLARFFAVPIDDLGAEEPEVLLTSALKGFTQAEAQHIHQAPKTPKKKARA